MQLLKDILFSRAQDLGANLCGVADLTADTEWIRENYGELCASFPPGDFCFHLFSKGDHYGAGVRSHPFL